MKLGHLTFVFLIMIFAITAQADCSKAYRRASYLRDLRNTLIVTGVAVGAGAGAVAIGSGVVAELLLVINQGFIITLLPLGVNLNNEGPWRNHFDRLLTNLQIASDTKAPLSSYLERLMKKVATGNSLELTDALKIEMRGLLAEGYQNDIFCPVVRIRSNGKVIGTAFNRKAVMDYLSIKLH